MPLSIDNDWQMLALYAIGAAILLVVLFNLPFVGKAIRSLFSLALMAFALFLLFQQAPFDPTLSRMTGGLGLERQQMVGDEVRIRQSRDGHFWADVAINGVERRMLVDSGATVTAISAATAEEASVESGGAMLPVLLQTANGTVAAETGSIDTLRVGAIEARDLKVVVSPALGRFDVLGMNFLSQLEGWRVEQGVLIMVPPEGPATEDAG